MPQQTDSLDLDSWLDRVTATLRIRPGIVDVEDLKQDAAVVALSLSERYDPEHPSRATWSTFAWHRVRGACLDRIASASRRANLHESLDQVDVIDTRSNIDLTLAASATRDLIAAALDSLPAVSRAIVVLYDIEGQPMAAVAERVSLTLSHCYATRRAALAAMRTWIEARHGCPE